MYDHIIICLNISLTTNIQTNNNMIIHVYTLSISTTA